jgi:hypothetical protein
MQFHFDVGSAIRPRDAAAQQPGPLRKMLVMADLRDSPAAAEWSPLSMQSIQLVDRDCLDIVLRWLGFSTLTPHRNAVSLVSFQLIDEPAMALFVL